MNFKYIFIAVLAALVMSCSDDDSVEDFDHAAQYETEKQEINDYLASHYYNSDVDLFEDLIDGETSLADDTSLVAIETTYNDIDYTLYIYETFEGIYVDEDDSDDSEDGGTKESPDDNDTVNVGYSLMSLENTVYQERSVQETIFSLSNLIIAWQIGLPYFKAGTFDESDSTLPRQYINSGEGFMIVPSGLAYQDFGSGDISANETLIFKVVLGTVTGVENEDEDE